MVPHASTVQLQTEVGVHVTAAVETMVDIRVWLTNQAAVAPTAPFRPLAEAMAAQALHLEQVCVALKAGERLLMEHQRKVELGIVPLEPVDRDLFIDTIDRLRRVNELFAVLNRDFMAHGARLNLAILDG